MKDDSLRMSELCYNLFMVDERGKELLDLMERYYKLFPVFPQSQELIERHGGPMAWAAFCEGQMAMLRHINHWAMEFANKMEAEKWQQGGSQDDRDDTGSS